MLGLLVLRKEYDTFECYHWTAPCCKPSVFTFMEASLECRFSQRYSLILATILDFCWRCEGVSVYQGEGSTIIHLSCLPGLFGVVKLTSAFIILSSRFILFLFGLMIASFTCIQMFLDFLFVFRVKKRPNLNSIPDINSCYLICVICIDVTRERATPGWKVHQLFSCPNTSEPLKMA